MKRNVRSCKTWGVPGMLVLAFLVGAFISLGAARPAQAGGIHFGFGIGVSWGGGYVGYDDYDYDDDYESYDDDYYDIDVDLWVEPGYRVTHGGGAVVSVHVRPAYPAYVLLYGVTPHGELVLLHPYDPYEVKVFGPTILQVTLPHSVWVYADDLTIFAVASPYPVLPMIPRYLVPSRWWRAGFHYGHGRWAIDLGYIYVHHGHYYIHGDPFHVAHYIYRDFRRSHHCGGRVAIGHTDYKRGRRSRVSWSRGYRSEHPKEVVKDPRGLPPGKRIVAGSEEKPRSRDKGVSEHKPGVRVGKDRDGRKVERPKVESPPRKTSPRAKVAEKPKRSKESKESKARQSEVRSGKKVKEQAPKARVEKKDNKTKDRQKKDVRKRSSQDTKKESKGKNRGGRSPKRAR